MFLSITTSKSRTDQQPKGIKGICGLVGQVNPLKFHIDIYHMAIFEKEIPLSKAHQDPCSIIPW